MPEHDLKKIARQHIDLAWNKGHLALVEQLHSPDFIYKSAFTAQPLDNTGYIRLLQDIRTAMDDLEVVVEDCIREERKVFTWSTLIGTIVRPALGYPASDRIVSISAMGFWVFNRQDQVQELCTLFDMESFRAQMGLPTRPFAEKALP